MIIKYFLKQISALALMSTSLVFAQTYPALEMGNVTPSPNTVNNLTVALQKDTNNNTATNLVNYTSPSPLTVNFTVNANSFTNAVRFGTNGAAPFYLAMNTVIGNAGNDNTQYTSNGVPTNGTGIDIAQNYAARVEANLATAGTQPGNGRVKLGEITITLSRGTNNPHLHFKGLGGSTTTSLTAEFTVRSVLNSAGTEILTGTVISQLSGTNLNVNNTNKTINNDYTGTTDPAAVNSARGTVRFQNNDIRTIVLEVFGNRNGANATAVAWDGLDAFFIGLSAAESDIQVTKTMSNTNAASGSNVNFVVTATNNGASNNSNINITDILPSGYTLATPAPVATSGTYNSGTGIWNIPTLNDGASATLTINATVNTTGNFTNTATVTSANLSDPNVTNNTASVSRAVDTDGDGIVDNLDLDDDNDGIPDCDENLFTSSVSNYFQINGNASMLSSNEIRLTPAVNSQAGQAWGRGKVDFTKNFTLQFQAYLGTNSGGADGIAIVFHNSPAGLTATGVNGDGLGARGIANGIVLELDSYSNTGALASDPAGSNGHGRIWRSSNQANLTNNIELGNLKDGVWRDVVVTWNVATQTISYTVGGVLAGSYTSPNISTDIFNGATKVFFGYTASTGGLNNDQRVRFLNPCSDLPLELDTDNDGTPDYLDLDSDNDGCFDAIEGDENVTLSQINANGSINIVANGGVNANGVPNLVNTSGAADIGGDIGQGIGTAQNSAIQDVQCANAFGCTTAMYLSQTATLYNISTTTNPFTYPAVGTASVNYNAIGLNPLDGRLYGMQNLSSTNVVVINTAGTSINLGPVTGLPAGVTFNAGEIDNLGNYYVKVNTNNSQLYRINLNTMTATLINLSQSINVSDITYRVSNGLLYGVSAANGQLVSINPVTGEVIGIGITPGAVNFGAMFGSSTGEIYGADNAGGFYQFNITNGQRVLISGSPSSNANDGAHCVTAPITFSSDLAVTKTNGVITYSSGTITTYTIVVRNNDPFGVLGATVSDPVPSGIPSANVSYTAVTAGGATTSVTGTQTGAINDVVSLPVGATVTYTVVVSIPFSFNGNLVNTVTVTPPVNITDTNSANNTATDTDTQAVCYRPAVTAGTVLDTSHGITSLNRAGNSASGNNWPMVRKGAWTALESKTKGFVLNRLSTAQIAAIPSADLVEGMMVYNTTLDCLQVNTTGTPAGWACFNTQTCPTN